MIARAAARVRPRAGPTDAGLARRRRDAAGRHRRRALWTDCVEAALRTPLVAAIALLVGAVAAARRRAARRARVRGEEALTVGGALAIGVAQAAALVPGVSRSGATIATGMALGLDGTRRRGSRSC